MDAQHAEIKERVQRFALSIHRTRQIHAHEVFNDAFAGAKLTGPDGKPLCSDSHPLSPSQPDKTQSNVMNAELSLEALEEARLRMLNWTDDRGNKLLRVPDTLLIPPALGLKARELLESPDRPDTADRAINVRRGAYKIIELPFLESSKAWFLVDSRVAKMFLKWFERRKPVPERHEDFDTETLKWKAIARYAYGFHHWSWIIGSNPA
ncbi:MAG: Mu-like prophage major head subunit gpT family protein [Elusimicrobiales bacterium]